MRSGLAHSPFQNMIPMEKGCVCSYCPIASAVGMRILEQGGNAVDAAVATGIALAVTYPQAGNLGGGGFMMIKKPGEKAAFLDYREVAPKKVHPKMFEPSPGVSVPPSVRGALSVAVPGTVAGFAAALERYGRLAWDQVFASAIDLAEKGSWITNRQATYLGIYERELTRYQSTSDIFAPGGKIVGPAELFVQKDLGRSLRMLAEEGPSAFYSGEIAKQIVGTIADGGGVLSLEDLAAYHATWREPIRRKVFGRDLVTSPLPTGGGIVVALSLALLEAANVSATPPGSARRYELLGRVFRIAFAQRARIAGDPERLPKDVIAAYETLIGATYDAGSIAALEDELGLNRGQQPSGVDNSSKNTTHYCVLDGEGMAVSNTYSLNTLFGSKLVAKGTGILLNNTIDDFGITPGVPNWYQLIEGEYNTLEPGRRPVGSMAPTLVLQDDKVELCIGASGGPRIPTSNVQVMLSMYVDGDNLAQAINNTRVHHQFVPASLLVEDTIAPEVVSQLETAGFDLAAYPRLGICAAIQRDTDDTLKAALDHRF